MGKFSRASIRKMKKSKESFIDTKKGLFQYLKNYLENPSNNNAKSFAESFRKYNGEKFTTRYNDLTIMIYIKSRDVDVIPNKKENYEIKEKVLELINKSYWEPTILRKILEQKEPTEKLKQEMIGDLEYKVGGTNGRGFKFCLKEDEIYYEMIDWHGHYKYEELKDFFKKVGKKKNGFDL